MNLVEVPDMGVGSGGRGRPSPPWILILFAKKKVVFLIARGKNQISPLVAPLEKNLGQSPTAPAPWKKSFRRPWLLMCLSLQKHRFNAIFHN